jgi:hypothetical protein
MVVCATALGLLALYISALSHLWMAVFESFCASGALLVLGCLLNPQLTFEREFSLFGSLQNAPSTVDRLILFDGDLREQPRLRCKFTIRNWPMLTGAFLISFGGAVALGLSDIKLGTNTNGMSENDSALLLFVWFASIVPLVIGSQWLVERLSVTKDDVVVGFVNQRSTEIGYEFQDGFGNYFGNTESQRQSINADNVVLVFLVKELPWLNRAHCGFRFHEISKVKHAG